jgi:hypothetical protein
MFLSVRNSTVADYKSTSIFFSVTIKDYFLHANLYVRHDNIHYGLQLFSSSLVEICFWFRFNSLSMSQYGKKKQALIITLVITLFSHTNYPQVVVWISCSKLKTNYTVTTRSSLTVHIARMLITVVQMYLYEQYWETWFKTKV